MKNRHQLNYECKMCNLYYKSIHNITNAAEIITIDSQAVLKKPLIEGSVPSLDETRQAIVDLANHGLYMANAASKNFIKLANGAIIPSDFSEMLHQEADVKKVPSVIRDRMLFDYKSIRSSLPETVTKDYMLVFTNLEVRYKSPHTKKSTPNLFKDEITQSNKSESLVLN
ncbi:hypothetical protein L3V82_01800 [Thiotrichales bacterium 19S3-7]|nr:hypothetical protein [Thiotrichales bacterium 19S3-7]MCF6800898.1 hypothetical protein [Thiotrichales bacterium 19S3-11]